MTTPYFAPIFALFFSTKVDLWLPSILTKFLPSFSTKVDSWLHSFAPSFSLRRCNTLILDARRGALYILFVWFNIYIYYLHVVPTLNKERKTLSSLLLDYDAAKSRLVNYRQKEGSGKSYSE